MFFKKIRQKYELSNAKKYAQDFFFTFEGKISQTLLGKKYEI